MGLLFVAVASACNAGSSTKSEENDNQMTEQNTTAASAAKVKITTTLGDITVLLYNDTPKHRDNFLKLAKDGYYEGTLFHRVIKDFMIQAGDPDSRNAAPGQQLGMGGPAYKIDAEIVYPKYFHKRGALAAARQGDQVNPKKQSSGSQFYIVTGRTVAANEMQQFEMNLVNKQKQKVFNELALSHRDEIIEMQRTGDSKGLQTLQNALIEQMEGIVAAQEAPAFTPEMREAYTTIGGTPHLDGDYTVFGEILDGMDVIGQIEKVATDRADRPKEDVRIISMEVLSE